MNPFNPIDPFAPELVAARKRTKTLCQLLNALRADQHKARKPIYQQLFSAVSSAYIEPNFFCDYGSNIFLGERFYANHNCVILDAAEVRIGFHARRAGEDVVVVVQEDDRWLIRAGFFI